MGLEPCLLEARCISKRIYPDNHEEYISILWLILPIDDEEYTRDQEKIIHPIDHYLLPEIYPNKQFRENSYSEKNAWNCPKELISTDEFERANKKDNHPNKHSERVGDDLSAKYSLPIHHRIHTEYDEGKNREKKLFFH